MNFENYHKYFALSREDHEWGVFIKDCGSIYFSAKAKKQSTGHPATYQFSWEKGRVLDEYQLIYIVKGKGIFESSPGRQISLKSGQLILIFPGAWHRYKSVQPQDWHTYWVGFSGRLTNDIIRHLIFTKANPVIDIGYHETLINCYRHIMEISQHEFPGYQQVLAGEIMKLVGWIHAIGKMSSFEDEGTSTIIQDARAMLRQPDQFPKVESVAVKLNMSYSKFRKLFRDYTGMSPGQFRMQHQIFKAKEMLTAQQLSIQEISYALGFESTQYFSRIFKRKTGSTPGGFRTLHQRAS
jgi:AraC-like DNA-binding protein